MSAGYRIALATPGHLHLLASIELAAAQLLRGHAPEAVLAEVTSEDVLQEAQREGRLWVALAGETPVGFAHVELLEPNVAHLEELDVRPDHGRRGLGTRLVREVCASAAERGFIGVTLATFRDVPWNMPFYARLGFEVVPTSELSSALQAVVDNEARRGLDPTKRVIMRNYKEREIRRAAVILSPFATLRAGSAPAQRSDSDVGEGSSGSRPRALSGR